MRWLGSAKSGTTTSTPNDAAAWWASLIVRIYRDPPRVPLASCAAPCERCAGGNAAGHIRRVGAVGAAGLRDDHCGAHRVFRSSPARQSLLPRGRVIDHLPQQFGNCAKALVEPATRGEEE